jgi:glucosamine kinase
VSGHGPLVVGMDVGGTSTRAVVASTSGEVLGAGRAGGGNPVSNGGVAAAASLRQALLGALNGVDPGRVRAAVVGLAGGSLAVTDPAVAAAMHDAWRGVGCTPQLVSDVLLAYVSGTWEPDGTVLACGTGAVAADVRGREAVGFADGHGWLLGDRGSGFWIGREALSATLDAIDRTGALPPLGRVVLIELGVPVPPAGAPPQELIAAVIAGGYGVPPVTLSRLSPSVLAAAATGDALATAIAHRAATHLVDTVRRVRDPQATTPIILGGSVLASPAIGDPVRAELHRLWPDAPLLPAGNTAAAAAWLALGSTDPAAYTTLLGVSAV